MARNIIINEKYEESIVLRETLSAYRAGWMEKLEACNSREEVEGLIESIKRASKEAAYAYKTGKVKVCTGVFQLAQEKLSLVMDGEMQNMEFFGVF